MSAEAAKVRYESHLLWTNKLDRYVADPILCSDFCLCLAHAGLGMCILTLSVVSWPFALTSDDCNFSLPGGCGCAYLASLGCCILQLIIHIFMRGGLVCRLMMRRQTPGQSGSAGPRGAANGNGTVGGSSNYVI